MQSRAKFAGHPVHPMLIVFPLGLLATAMIFDIIHLAGGGDQWATAAYWMIPAGVIGGLIAAIFGLIDWLAIPSGTRARRIGAVHGLGNVVVVGLFAASWFLRRGDFLAPSALAYVLSFAGAGLALVTGWLGGELVDRLGVGVDDGANLDAPNSLRSRDARESAASSRVVAH
ncbi:MAG TPA: DUF2231 domain-containing protein [Gemmatimonadaceae bacterium]|nr:DUF2231 domain-containing protein [Gemmatimonadaceae bacterium]